MKVNGVYFYYPKCGAAEAMASATAGGVEDVQMCGGDRDTNFAATHDSLNCESMDVEGGEGRRGRKRSRGTRSGQQKHLNAPHKKTQFRAQRDA